MQHLRLHPILGVSLSNTYEAALKYATERGFSVFPTHGIKTVVAGDKKLLACTCGINPCTSPGKHPAISKGRNASSKSEAVLQNLWASRDYLNVAIATGEESGIFVIDIDGLIGEESFSTLEKEYSKLPKTLTSITGRGRHLLFKYPNKKVFNRTSALGPNLDIRGSGGYIISPPSTHISGIQYEWEDENSPISEAPQWLLDLVCSNAKAPVVNESVLTFDSKTEWSMHDVQSMMEFLDPNMGYTDWINIGMALNEGGYSFDIWDSWSKRSSKYDGSTIAHWRSFKPGGGITMGTLVDAAMIRGWKPAAYITHEKIDWDTHPAKDWLIEIGVYTPYPDKTLEDIKDQRDDDFPIDIYNDFTGIIGETIRWICDTAIKPQPVLAMLNTITALGAIFGRRYASPINTRTNLFSVGISHTGSGKDHSRRKIKEIMNTAGLSSFIASDEIKSGAGMGTTLNNTPACIMMLDEFGLVLQSISGEKAASYKAEISEMLLKIYTSSGSEYKFGTYADKKTEQITLKDPHLCIYGTTTLDTYIKALKKMAIHSGQLNRFIVLPGLEEPERRFEDAKRGVPDDLLELWKEIIPAGKDLTALNSGLIAAPPLTEVGWGDTRAYYNKLCVLEDKRVLAGKETGTGELWGRFSEHVIKVAMIFAICRSPITPILQIDDVKMAEIIVQSGTEYVIDLAMNYMYENAIEKDKKNILGLIRKGGHKGVARKDLTSISGGMKMRDFDEIIKCLIDEERVEAVMEKSKTRNRIIYKSV